MRCYMLDIKTWRYIMQITIESKECSQTYNILKILYVQIEFWMGDWHSRVESIGIGIWQTVTSFYYVCQRDLNRQHVQHFIASGRSSFIFHITNLFRLTSSVVTLIPGYHGKVNANLKKLRATFQKIAIKF